MAVADPEYKIILLGEPGVGKTTLFHRVRTGEFMDTGARGSIGLPIMEGVEHRLSIGSTEVKAYIYDTGGGERFRTLTLRYYRDADAAILMYSVEDRYTFENLQEWIGNCGDNVEDLESFVWAVMGNKSDLPMEIEQDRIKARCEQLGTTLCFFASAKTGENCLSSLEKVIEEIHRKKRGATRKTKDNETVKLHGQQQQPNTSCCNR